MSYPNGALETIEREGPGGAWTVKIYADDDVRNPFKEYDQLGKIVHWHRDYDFGERIDPSTLETSCPMCNGLGTGDPIDCDECGDTGRCVTGNVVEWLRETHDAVVILPLGLLDHSGLHMWVGGGAHWTDSAGWDSGTVGFIYATREDVLENWGVKSLDQIVENHKGEKLTVLEYAERVLRNEIETFDQYLTGDVYGYVIYMPDGEESERIGDSCWGFYGWEYAVDEAVSALESAVEWEAEQEAKVAEVMAI